MSLRYIRGGFTASHEYVCLSCRLQCRLSQARQNIRRQHTSTQSADSTPRLPNGADPALPLQLNVAKDRQGDENRDFNVALNTLPARKAKQLQLTLQQKFLEKRRQEGSTSPAPRNTDVASSPKASEPISKRNEKMKAAGLVADRAEDRAKMDSTEAQRASNAEELKRHTILSKKKKTIAKRAAKGTENGIETASTEAHKASDAGNSEEEIILRKKKTKKARKEEKPKDGAKKAGVTTLPSGPALTAKPKSDVAELKKASKCKIEDERNLGFTRVVSNSAKKSEVNAVQRLFVPISDICELQPSTALDIPNSSENENGRELKIRRKRSKRSKVNAVQHLFISISDICEL